VGVATAFNRRTLALHLAPLLVIVLLLATSSVASARQAESQTGAAAPEPCTVTLPTEHEREPNDEAPDAQPLTGPACVTGESAAGEETELVLG